MRCVITAVLAFATAGACRDGAQRPSSATVATHDSWDALALRGFSIWDKPKRHRDEAEALLAFQQSCDHGSQLGCAGLGTLYLSSRTSDTHAIELLRQACDANVGRACVALSTAYESGFGVERDGVKAATIAREACEGGEHRACILYARAMLFGDHNVAKDPSRARDLAVRACSEKVAAGCTLAGLAYSTVLNDVVEAQKWLDQGCEQGDGPGCAALAVHYFRGGLPGDAQGVGRLPQRGVELAMRACDLDAAIGCSLLAKALANGEGVPQDLRRASELATKACGDADAAGCSIAAQLARADGRSDEAMKFLERSCKLGNAPACRAVAPDRRDTR